jgi:hypothetical protein
MATWMISWSLVSGQSGTRTRRQIGGRMSISVIFS